MRVPEQDESTKATEGGFEEGFEAYKYSTARRYVSLSPPMDGMGDVTRY